MLSVDPDLILAEDGAGPPEAIELLRDTQVPVVTIPMGFDRAAVITKINAVADALGVSERGAELARRVGAEFDRAAAHDLSGKKVLFVLAIQGGRVMAGGEDTASAGIIALTGAENAAPEFKGYKLLTDEAILTAAPDVILVMNSRGEMNLDNETLLAHPALWRPRPPVETGRSCA